VTDRNYDFMASEPEVYDLLLRFVAQWRAKVGAPDRDRRALIVCEALDQIAEELDLRLQEANDEAYMVALRRLSDVLMELPSTDVWGAHDEPDRWEGARVFCRLHGTVHGTNGAPYTACDRLAWIGDKMLKAKYELKDIWPEPGVWSSWFESSRRRH
jgi:hypothetical protein